MFYVLRIPRLFFYCFVVRLGLGLPGSCDIALLHLGFHVFHVDAESVQCIAYVPKYCVNVRLLLDTLHHVTLHVVGTSISLLPGLIT